MSVLEATAVDQLHVAAEAVTAAARELERLEARRPAAAHAIDSLEERLGMVDPREPAEVRGVQRQIEMARHGLADLEVRTSRARAELRDREGKLDELRVEYDAELAVIAEHDAADAAKRREELQSRREELEARRTAALLKVQQLTRPLCAAIVEATETDAQLADVVRELGSNPDRVARLRLQDFLGSRFASVGLTDIARPLWSVFQGPLVEPREVHVAECTVCSHEQRAAIEDALDAGDAIRAIETAFSIGRGSLGRHRKHTRSG